jgi:hypothetical protein
MSLWTMQSLSWKKSVAMRRKRLPQGLRYIPKNAAEALRVGCTNRTLNSRPIRHSFKSTMCGARKQVRSRLKPEKGEKPQARANKRLTEQIRKILGKHYASKYRVR